QQQQQQEQQQEQQQRQKNGAEKGSPPITTATKRPSCQEKHDSRNAAGNTSEGDHCGRGGLSSARVLAEEANMLTEQIVIKYRNRFLKYSLHALCGNDGVCELAQSPKPARRLRVFRAGEATSLPEESGQRQQVVSKAGNDNKSATIHGTTTADNNNNNNQQQQQQQH
ncbi:unnamed protein product, partial [Polarella glacialis]